MEVWIKQSALTRALAQLFLSAKNLGQRWKAGMAIVVQTDDESFEQSSPSLIEQQPEKIT